MNKSCNCSNITCLKFKINKEIFTVLLEATRVDMVPYAPTFNRTKHNIISNVYYFKICRIWKTKQAQILISMTMYVYAK